MTCHSSCILQCLNEVLIHFLFRFDGDYVDSGCLIMLDLMSIFVRRRCLSDYRLVGLFTPLPPISFRPIAAHTTLAQHSSNGHPILDDSCALDLHPASCAVLDDCSSCSTWRVVFPAKKLTQTLFLVNVVSDSSLSNLKESLTTDVISLSSFPNFNDDL